jgi:hypothetical protein
MLADRMASIIMGTGHVASVWHKAEEGGVITLLCRAHGTGTQEKDKSMLELAKKVVPQMEGRVLVAKQFIQRDGKLGYAWNISIFGNDAVDRMEALLRPKEGTSLHASTPTESGRGLVPGERGANLQSVIRDTRDEDGVYVVSFPLPHVGSHRNAPVEDPTGRSPLGWGRGAVALKSGAGAIQ